VSCFSLLGALLPLSACAQPAPKFVDLEPVLVTVTVDNDTLSLNTSSANVRELLEEAAITLNDADLVDPPLFTPLVNGMSIIITRVTESVEVIEQSIPYQRRTVRNESMQADDPPIIVQAGQPGLQELTVRIVYHDGLEYSRQDSRLTVIEPAQDEIVMVGVGSAPGTVEFDGLLAYIAGGNSILLRNTSAFPEQINTGGDLDRRVYELSPSGGQLLYTRATTDTERFNSLWVVSTTPGSEPRPVGVDNVLWAAWNPDKVDRPQIAYTTGLPTDLLPGWEANNDLWLVDFPLSPGGSFRPRELIEAYPATYGWWGGEYAWSPVGRYIAYSYADEIGVIDTEASEGERRVRLHTFTEYNTQADWVWVPNLTWSPDGGFIAFSKHSGHDPEALLFDVWVANVATGTAARFVQQSGIWGYPQWSPAQKQAETAAEDTGASQIAFLRATDPVESLRSTYTLWLMDRDGSNGRQIYPAAGENSRFPHEQSALAWGPAGNSIVFVYDGDLFLYTLDDGNTQRITHDDSVASNPSRAPYGRAWREAQTTIERPSSPAQATVEPGIGPAQ
jgi:WD40 repeat protein